VTGSSHIRPSQYGRSDAGTPGISTGRACNTVRFYLQTSTSSAQHLRSTIDDRVVRPLKNFAYADGWRHWCIHPVLPTAVIIAAVLSVRRSSATSRGWSRVTIFSAVRSVRLSRRPPEPIDIFARTENEPNRYGGRGLQDTAGCAIPRQLSEPKELHRRVSLLDLTYKK